MAGSTWPERVVTLLSGALARRPGPKRLQTLLADFWATAAVPAARPAGDLPAPVARYLQRALEHAGAAPMAVGLAHRAELNRSLTRDAWWSVRSRQWMAVHAPGFVWSANVRGAPGLSVDVVDAYVRGRGELGVWMWGLLPLGGAVGSDAIARGELMRWLAEAVLVPWALAACPGLQWRAVDPHHAEAQLVAAGVAVTLRFAFGEDGLVRSVQGDRPRLVGGRFVDTPWIGRWSNWQHRGGVLVPTAGEVAWTIDGQARPYWRGTLATWQALREPPPPTDG
jgi:hypothetical protein